MAIPDLASGKLPDPAHLRAVLAYKSSRRFFNEFSTFAAYFYTRRLADWPRLFRMYHVLMTLDISAGIGDLGGFFDEHEARVGAYAHEAEDFLREIKARRTADLLAAAIELFPGGRVPTDHRKRDRLTERIREQELDPFEEINRRHKGAIGAMHAPFQRYMRAHARELLAHLESAAGKKRRKWRALDVALASKTPAARLAGGAPKQHAALYVFPRGVIPRDQTKRQRALEKNERRGGERTTTDLWTALNSEYHHASTKLHEQLYDCVRAHREELPDPDDERARRQRFRS